MVGHIRQVRQIAGVGQGVKVDNMNIGFVFQYVVDEVAADEAATSGHKHRNHGPSWVGVREFSSLTIPFFRPARQEVGERRVSLSIGAWRRAYVRAGFSLPLQGGGSGKNYSGDRHNPARQYPERHPRTVGIFPSRL